MSNQISIPKLSKIYAVHDFLCDRIGSEPEISMSTQNYGFVVRYDIELSVDQFASLEKQFPSYSFNNMQDSFYYHISSE